MSLYINGKLLQKASHFGTITIQGDSLTCPLANGNAVEYIFGKNATIVILGNVDTLQVIRGDARINVRTATQVQTEKGDIYITHSCKKVHTDSGNVIFPPASERMSNPLYNLQVDVKGVVGCVKTTQADVWVGSADEVTTFAGLVMCYGRVNDATTETGCIAASSTGTSLPPIPQPRVIRRAPIRWTGGRAWNVPAATYA